MHIVVDIETVVSALYGLFLFGRKRIIGACRSRIIPLVYPCTLNIVIIIFIYCNTSLYYFNRRL